MSQGFAFPLDQRFWLSLGNILPSLQEASHLKLAVFARLKEGVSAQEAQVELNLLAENVDESFSTDKQEQGLVVVRPFVEAYTTENRRPLWLMSGAGLGVLLIGCANVTNLLLARWTVRRRELAVRAALGAGQWVLARHVLFDAVVLAGFGAIAGVAIAQAGIHLYNSSGGLVDAFWVDICLSPLVLLVVLVVSLGVALLSGLIALAGRW